MNNVNPKFIELLDNMDGIEFIESTHTYLRNGEKYGSVTGFIKKFEAEKDWESIKARYAAKNGMSVDEVTKLWESKGKNATDMGTEVHKYLELKWNRKLYEGTPEWERYPEFLEYVKNCDIVYEKLVKHFIPIAAEYIVFDDDFKLGGTIDLLCYNKTTDSWAILDWKTSKTIDKVGKFGDKMKNELHEYDDINYHHYSLQLSMYKYMLKKRCGIDVKEMMLVRIGKGEVNDKPNVEFVPCVDFSNFIPDIEKRMCPHS